MCVLYMALNVNYLSRNVVCKAVRPHEVRIGSAPLIKPLGRITG